MESLSFDGMVERYDETRSVDPDYLNSVLDIIAERFPPRTFPRLFEPGIGTGRIAFPMTERGYRVTGVDISAEMLAALRGRLSRLASPAAISALNADVTTLPFPDGSFDLALAVHLFYFIRDWRQAARELLRTVVNHGPVILMHTGTGAEIPALNARYKSLCAELGQMIEPVGVTSTREVVEYYESIGCRCECMQDGWEWTAHLRLNKALDHLESRAYSFTTFASDDVHKTVIEQLRAELSAKHTGLDVEIAVPNRIYLAIIHGAKRGG